MGSFLRALGRLPATFTREELFDLARQHRYDGAITIHFRGGIPSAFDAGRPVHGTIAVDKPGRPGASSSGMTVSTESTIMR